MLACMKKPESHTRDSWTIEGYCETCGELVTIMVSDDMDGQQHMMCVHDGCIRPTLKMLCDNPRKLGVISSE